MGGQRLGVCSDQGEITVWMQRDGGAVADMRKHEQYVAVEGV
jgi:hypothetical protein